MSFKILYITATRSEADTLKKAEGMISVPGGYNFRNNVIIPLVTGIGSVATAWGIKKWLSENDKPDIAINAGIAGSYKNGIEIGSVVMPVSECFADAGIEDGTTFLTMAEAGLINPDEFPYRDGLLHSDNKYVEQLRDHIKQVKAITVNTATGSLTTREKLIKKFNPDIETMEGATFFYICARENIPFLAIRSISNRVELRDKSKWNIKLALDNLSEKLSEVILTLD